MGINNSPKPDFVENAMKSWKACLPSELSNLFYIEDHGYLKRVNAFILDLDEGDKLVIKDKIKSNKVHAVKIGMGCTNGKFSPIFCIITEPRDGQYQYYYFRMMVTPMTVSQGVITKGVELLFVRKWLELNDNELRKAFFGTTIGDIKNVHVIATGSTPIEDLRVNFYTYEQSDALKIVAHLKHNLDAPNYGLRLLFGAGLTVRITHPFDFRPIIQIYGESEDTNSTFFERSKPCPPYCNTAGF